MLKELLWIGTVSGHQPTTSLNQNTPETAHVPPTFCSWCGPFIPHQEGFHAYTTVDSMSPPVTTNDSLSPQVTACSQFCPPHNCGGQSPTLSH